MASTINTAPIRNGDATPATEIKKVFAQAKTDIEALQARVAVVQAASTASDVATLKTDFNALLTKLKNAGLMASS